MRTISFKVTTTSGSVFERAFDVDTVLIGSGPSAVLRVDDGDVSSIHAVVKATAEGGLTIVDLGSEAGTTVNGQAVLEPLELRAEDRIGLGRVVVVVTGVGASAALPSLSEDLSLPAPAAPSTATTAGPSTAPITREPKAAQPSTKTAAGPQAEPANVDHRAPSKTAKGQFDVKTEVITDRSSKNGKAPDPVTPEADLDVAVLKKPLAEENKPTTQQHALQIIALWGDMMVDAVLVREPRAVTVGTTKDADLCVETDAPFVIATNGGTEATINVPSGAKAGLRKADGSISRDVAGGSVRLAMGERVAFKVGTLTYVAQFVRGEAELGKGLPVDWFFPRVFAIVALFHLFVVAAAILTPNFSSTLTDDLFKNQNRFAQMILKAPEKEKERKKLDLSGAKGAKAKDEEGKFGKKDTPKKDALASKAGAPRVDPNKREKDRKIALNSGLLGMLGKSGAVSNVFGPGGLGSGINNAMGGLQGSEMGDAGGAGGLGTRGAGAGGGGNSLGIGGLGTHGNGRGSGGYGNIDLGGRGKGETRIVPGKTVIQGALSKEEIGRVIRRNLARFKYCYEKQLNANPNLSGKIAIYFTIAPTGSVADASVRETSMNDVNVEECAVKVMRTLKFPQPKGGGVVVVTYPFVFQST